MFKLRACIFDLDGVLVDTARYHYMAWKRMADILGAAFTEEDNEHLKGVSRSGSLEYVLRKAGKEVSPHTFAELMAQKNDWYLELIQHMHAGELLPNAALLLKELRQNGVRIGLGSASQNAQLILRQTGLLPFFDTVVDGTRTSRSKPDPEVFLIAANDLQVHPHEAIVFEDARNGIEAAVQGGFKTIGIGKKENLPYAQHVFPDLTSLNFHTISTLVF